MKPKEKARKQFRAVNPLVKDLPAYLQFFALKAESHAQDPFKLFTDVSEWDDGLSPRDDVDHVFEPYTDWSFFKSKKSAEQNEITVYSTIPIENGVVVSPSKIWMEELGETNYSKTLKLDDVLWVDSFSGQVAVL